MSQNSFSSSTDFEREKIETFIQRWNESTIDPNRTIKQRLTDYWKLVSGTKIKTLSEIQQKVESLGFPIFMKENVEMVNLTRKIDPWILDQKMPKSDLDEIKLKKFEEKNVIDVVKVLNSTSLVIEAAQSYFYSLPEPALRFIYLAALNSVFGVNGSAEAFRGSGQTDILLSPITYEDALIIECKKWAGPEKLTEAFRQLKNYRIWKDRHLVTIQFVDLVQSMTKTLETAFDHSNSIYQCSSVEIINSNIIRSEHIFDGDRIIMFQIYVELKEKSVTAP